MHIYHIYIWIPFSVFLWCLRGTRLCYDLCQSDVKISASAYRFTVSASSLFSFRYNSFAMLLAPFTDQRIRFPFIRIVTTVQFWFSCTPIFPYLIPSGGSESLIFRFRYGISPSLLLFRYRYSSRVFWDRVSFPHLFPRCSMYLDIFQHLIHFFCLK